MKSIVSKILLEAATGLPNKHFEFEDLNGGSVDAIIGPSPDKNDSVVIGYQVNGTRNHSENENAPDVKNLFYILGRVIKFVENYIKQYYPKNIIVQSDYEIGSIAEKRINMYKQLVDKNLNNLGYSSKTGRNKNGYFILLTLNEKTD